MNSRYDELDQLIKNWSLYVKLHRRVYSSKSMNEAWTKRIHRLEVKIHSWKFEKALIGELNQ